VAEVIAKAAEVGKSTVERVLRLQREDPEAFDKLAAAKTRKVHKDGKERRLSALPEKDDDEDWACTLSLTVPHSKIPSSMRALRGLGFAGGGGSSRKMRLPAGASVKETVSIVEAAQVEPEGQDDLSDHHGRLLAIARALKPPLERLVAAWPADAGLEPLIHEVRAFLGYAEREKERRLSRHQALPPKPSPFTTRPRPGAKKAP
jgi:hypothetical protein